MSVTQKQLARHLGISQTQVGSALSGNGRINDETRRRVLEAAKQLGYDRSTNHEARALIARRYGKRINTDIIAVVMASSVFDGKPLTGAPYFQDILRGVEEAACNRQLDLFFCSYNERHQPRLLREGGVDGLICLGMMTNDIRSIAHPTKIVFDEDKKMACGLAPDNRGGAALATRHLIELGHRRIACFSFTTGITPGDWYASAVNRMKGYRDAMAQAGLPIDEDLLVKDIQIPTEEAGVAAMQKLLARKRKFTALVCFNDLIAMGAIQVLRIKGVRVPHDVSVVGFDDVSEQYSFRPKITSIGFDRFAMGKRAVELICARREEADEIKRTLEIFPVELKIKASTAKASKPAAKLVS